MTQFCDNALEDIATALSAALRARGETLATAESCTGGWIAKVLTDLAGSSDVFTDGFITYSDEAKTRRLGVPASLVAIEGAVSEPVVRAMVAGALGASGAMHAVAVSGVAGPGGGSPDKPVGTVWIGWGSADGQRRTRRFVFQGDREQVRRATVAEALQGVLA